MTTPKLSGISKRTIFFSALAAILLCVAVCSTAFATLGFMSDSYELDFETSEISVSLSEQGEDADSVIVDDATLLSWMKDDEPLKLGYTYNERIAAINTSSQPEYVRVVVNKYWIIDNAQEGDSSEVVKDTTLNPSLIQLGFNTEEWTIDPTNPQSKEQTVLYSKNPIAPGASCNVVSTLRVDPSILTMTSSSETNNHITTLTYAYNNVDLGIDVECDALQTHNATDAMRDAWGINPELLGINI